MSKSRDAKYSAQETQHRFEAALRTFPILYVQSDAVVLTEVEFRHVAVQILLFAMLVHAAYAALENREVAFDN